MDLMVVKGARERGVVRWRVVGKCLELWGQGMMNWVVDRKVLANEAKKIDEGLESG